MTIYCRSCLLNFIKEFLPLSRAGDEGVRTVSMELEAVISSCVAMLQSNPQLSREEVARLLNRWEELGYISRQMRAVIIQRLRENQPGGQAPGKPQE
jgi:Cdc6-like AAA superfamily ATPase